MKRRYRILRDVSLTRKKTGRTVIFKCEYFKESLEDYILITNISPVKAHAVLYPKALWSLAKTVIPGVGASMGYDPPEEKLPPLPDDDDELPPEVIKEIEGGGASSRGEGSIGDITKELPGEYNVKAQHEVLSTDEATKRILTMQSHIDANFARDEGERKYKQAIARRRLMENVERAGAGFVPE